jgi:hypothetical protein
MVVQGAGFRFIEFGKSKFGLADADFFSGASPLEFIATLQWL